MTGRGKKPSESKKTHLRTPEYKPKVPEEPCPDDEIYINSPQNNTSETQVKKAQSVTKHALSKPKITHQQSVDADKELESNYSSLNLAQRDSVDVYEAHATGPTFITPEPIKEISIPLEETPLPSKQDTTEEFKPYHVHCVQKYKKKILVLVGIMLIAFVASIFGGLIVGSAMSSMVANIMQQTCAGESTTTNTSVTNSTTETPAEITTVEDNSS